MDHKASTNFQYGKWLASPSEGEEVVISGVSARFPKCHNVEEFWDNLLKEKDMLGDSNHRWNENSPDILKKVGTIPDVSKFDPGFFGIHSRQAHNMDPLIRQLLEVAVEAVVDGGVHPSELKGTKTGVFVGCSWSESEEIFLDKFVECQQFRLTGYLRCMMADRLSYFFQIKGPSYVADTACNSFMNALDHAFRAIRNGRCDKALVASGNILLHPGPTLQYYQLGVLSDDGSSNVFDENARGYVRSEAIGCIFLQKAKDSKRIYAQILHSKISCDGFTPSGLLSPSSEDQARLLREVYNECGITPDQLSFFEAHASATKVGDLKEVEVIDQVLGKLRQKPLLIGSVKSNVGHTEAASCMCSIMKAVLAIESNVVAPNLHFRKAKKGMVGIEEGRLVPVTKKTLLEGDDIVIGINNFGFGGSNGHLILKRLVSKKSEESKVMEDVPRLVCVSGRTEEAVITALEHLNGTQVNVEHVGLIHQVFKKNFSAHGHRGFTIISKNQHLQTSPYLPSIQPPPFYIKFGKFDLSYKSVRMYFLNFPPFATTMEKISTILNKNIMNLLYHKKKECYDDDNIGAIAVQLGVVDLLKELELQPTGIWTNSFNKLAYAYLNQILTLEQTLQQAIFNIEKNSSDNFQVIDNFSKEELGFSSQDSIVLNLSDEDMVLANNPKLILNILGRLYLQGHNPQLHKLYPSVNFPVGRMTPTISSLVNWRHDQDWLTYKFRTLNNFMQKTESINVQTDEYKYLEGNVVGDRNLFPVSGYLNLVWKVFAGGSALQETCPVVFENCKFIRTVALNESSYTTFNVAIQGGSGNFEIMEDDNTLVAKGRIFSVENMNDDTGVPDFDEGVAANILQSDEIYRELHLRGYGYSDHFKGIAKCNAAVTSGLIKWEDNWVTFMDNMLQMSILSVDSRLQYLPVAIKKITIDPVKHLKLVEGVSVKKPLVPVHVYKENKTIKSGGIEILDVRVRSTPKQKLLQKFVNEKYEFVPNEAHLDLSQSVRMNIQIVLEESMEKELRAVELIDHFTKARSTILMPLVKNVLEDIPSVYPDLIISTKDKIENVAEIRIESLALTRTNNLSLIIATNIFQRPSLLEEILNVLSADGFVLTREDKDFNPAEVIGIKILTQHSTKDEKLILFKRSKPAASSDFIEISSTHFEWISELQDSLKNESNAVVHCKNQQLEGILGFTKCIRREPGGKKVKCFFMMDEAPDFDPFDKFYRQQIEQDRAINVYKEAKWGTYRHFKLENNGTNPKNNVYIGVDNKEGRPTLEWIEGPPLTTNKDQDIIQVFYSSINYKNIVTAWKEIVFTNDMTEEFFERNEYSGRDSRGNRVMGMVAGGVLSTFLPAHAEFSWPVPPDWSLEDAATVPATYSIVIYALLLKRSLNPGTSILVHSSLGNIGLAVLNVALYYKCNIFVSTETQEQRDCFRRNFPQVSKSHIGSFRVNSFERVIRKETKGRGVDIILCSPMGEKLETFVSCLARGGTFVEIGRCDSDYERSFDLHLLEKESSYRGVMLDALFGESSEVKKKLIKSVAEGIKCGYVKPLPANVFGHDEIEKAFRYMTMGEHTGKVLIKFREENESLVGTSDRLLLEAVPRFYCDGNKTYIIIGGLGGFGLELANWLVLRGAKKLVLSSRFGLKNGYQTQRVNSLKSRRVSVHISTSDVCSKSGCLSLIQEANELGPVDGIFNLAMVLKDGLFENQRVENFTACLAPKVQSSKHLDEITRRCCPQLRYFVVFSSFSCGQGFPGQTNYGMANSVMERICEKRKLDGFPALAIQWSAIGEVGLVTRLQKSYKGKEILGTIPQPVSTCLEVLDNLLNQDNTIVSSIVVADKRKKNDVSGSVVEVVANVLGINDVMRVSHHATLPELGMDSITSQEVLQQLKERFKIVVTPREIRTMTFSKLSELKQEMKETLTN